MQMHSIIAMGLGLALTLGAQANPPPKALTRDQIDQMVADMRYWTSERRRFDATWARAKEIAPARRNTPLRMLNISDVEVREVQSIAALYLPRETMNISPVVTDCACEEGITCTAQVYVVATNNIVAKGLQLSRMNDRWQVGQIQQWWFQWDAVRRTDTGDAMYDDYLYEKARHDLLDQFPMCVARTVPATAEVKQ